MRPITEFLKDGQWTGRRAFVVGSGPSLKGFDRRLLENELTIGCNMEYKWGPTIALAQDERIMQGDGAPGFLPLLGDVAWRNTPGMTAVYFHGHPDKEIPNGSDWIAIAKSDHSREKPFQWGKSLETGLYYGANCGMAAINLAEILGANPIYLLGFDAVAADSAQHCHDSYPAEWLMQDQESKDSVYGRWVAEFRRIAKLLKPETRVVNLNPDSAIDAFPKAKLGTAYVPPAVFPSMFDCWLGHNTLTITPVGL